MTRAEERLIIAGYQGARTPPEDCWYRMVRRSLEPGAEEVADPVCPDLTILRRGRTRVQGAQAIQADRQPNPERPGWLRVARPAEGKTARVRPSHAVDLSRARGSSEPAAEGLLVHKLLQHLPDVAASWRRAAGERFLAAQKGAPGEVERVALVSTAIAVLDHPACARLFAPSSLAEAEIAAMVALPDGGNVEVSGRMDRLVASPAEVLFCDFKTGAAPGSLEATPRAHLTQAALYQAALASVYSDRPVRAFLIWTEGPQIMELPPGMLNEALAAIAAAP
jgi:ATP-dependent helicase/nuclease subunit A